MRKSNYTVDDIPIKNITNGTIFLDNGLKVTGIKIMPKNIFILDYDMQNAIIANLKNVYNTIDYEFWIIAADRPVDISLYLSQLQVQYNSIQDNVKRKLIIDDINKANMFMNNNVVDTEYFLLFKEKDNELIQKRIRNLINTFASASLSSNQVTNDDLRMILDNFLNGGKKSTFGTVMS
ncbi:MAG: hypothetical protein RSB77_01610 [Bacilli bacterium]